MFLTINSGVKNTNYSIGNPSDLRLVAWLRKYIGKTKKHFEVIDWTDAEIGMMVMSNKNSNYMIRGKIHDLLY